MWILKECFESFYYNDLIENIGNINLYRYFYLKGAEDLEFTLDFDWLFSNHKLILNIIN